MVRVSSPAKLRPYSEYSELTAKMVMGVVPGLVKTRQWVQCKSLRNKKSAQRGSFRPDVPADIRPKTSVRFSNPGGKKKTSLLAQTWRVDVHEKTLGLTSLG